MSIDFRYWFIGFVEGNGLFIVNKTRYLEFKVTQPSVDAQILFYIKKELGFGSVSIQDKNQRTHHYRVRNKDGLLRVIEIFNGNLYTKKKTNQFILWLEAFNKIYSASINFIPNISIPTLDNAWLSGFTDAEGCFTAEVFKRSEIYNQVQVRYILSQKGELEFVSKVSALLGGKISYLKSYGGYNMTVNLLALGKSISYFNTYKLKTKKRLDYINWLKVYEKVINKEHFTEIGIQEIQKIVLKINKKF